MNIEKRGKAYRIRKTYKGMRYYITIDHKPTLSEARLLIDEYIETKVISQNPKLLQCAIAYNQSKDGVISSSTMRSYNKMKKGIPESIAKLKLSELNDYNMQKAISEYAKGKKYYTVKTMYTYLLEVIKMFDNRRFNIKLPQKEKSNKYIPTIEDVQKIFEYTKNTKFGALFVLLCYGLRIGEALALTKEDIKENYIDINKAKSIDVNGRIYIKSPKNYYSVRRVPMPKEYIDYIKTYGCNWNTELTNRRKFASVLNELNIPYFSFHSLRHFFCSYCQSIGVGIPNLKAVGGWSNGSNVMEKIYSHEMGVTEPITMPLFEHI